MVTSPWAMVVTDGLHRVTGALTPDATGDYLPHGMHGGHVLYRRTDGAYYIWWHVTGNWIISTEPDILAPGHWHKLGPPIEGLYDPDGTYLGIPTVTEI